ncbi:MAG: universal stress protein [Nitrososphaeraceae archaeon]|nr:universal stress protein [Nitrososphaeraceae archaeon]MBV9668589.1 universal stress protein [Nitrososphaeraceae archaeon]
MVTSKFSKILVAVDGSQSSMDAVDYAISITKKASAFLIALHVMYSPAGYAYSDNMLGFVTPSSIEDLLEKCKQEFQPWFDKIKEKAYNNNKIQLKTDLILTPTSIVGAIIQYAEDEKVDLVVIGSRGRSGIKKMLLGSVAAGVVTYADCAVIVVK